MYFSAFSTSVLAALSVSLAPGPVCAGLTGYTGFECDGYEGAMFRATAVASPSTNMAPRSAYVMHPALTVHSLTV